MIKRILIKLNMARKWFKSFLAPPGLVASLFHKQYYKNLEYGHFETGGRNITRWLGTRVVKPPSDLWAYQEIIWETKPDIIIECGTFEGGCAYYMASICDLLKNGHIITIDIADSPLRPAHPRITYMKGSTIADDVIARVRHSVPSDKRIMVILDSNHRKGYVLKEIGLYASLVSQGCYLIVEDTHLNGHPIESNYGPGPMEAVEEFLKHDSRFEVDRNRENFMLSFNHKGYLKRK